MTRREMKKLDTRIKTIKKAAEELKALSGGMQAVDRNVRANSCLCEDARNQCNRSPFVSF